MTTWFITGCTSGFGRRLAEATLADGYDVVVSALDPSTVKDLVDRYPDRALAVALDVTDREQVVVAVRAAEERFGAVDVLVNNAGYGYRAAVEEGESDAVERLFATHFFGPVALIQAVLPGMRSRRSGTIVNFSTIAVRTSPPGSGFYAAAKSALEVMTGSLRKEIAPLGIVAMAVEPGGFRTEFSGSSLTQAAVPIADYATTAGVRRIENDTAHGHQPGDPEKAARAIIDAVNSSAPPSLLVLGADALQSFRTSLDVLGTEITAWESVTLSTGVDT